MLSQTFADRWYPARALAMKREELIELFSRLATPDPDEMVGDFAGYAHLGDTAEDAARETAVTYDKSSRYWLGKSFSPLVDGRGTGYNRFTLPDGKIHGLNRFDTEIGPSHLAAGDAFIVRYGAFTHAMGLVDGIDDIRRLGDGVYLGLASARQEDGRRGETLIFVLQAVAGEWVPFDDDGFER